MNNLNLKNGKTNNWKRSMKLELYLEKKNSEQINIS